MIIVELQGGLGNQLFQIAHAYSLSVKHQRPFAVYPTPVSGQGNPGSKYEHTLYRYLNFVPELPRNHTRLCETVFGQPPTELPGGTVVIKCFAQSMRLWTDEDSIRSLFHVPNSDRRKGLAIHVRGGDYLRYPEIYDVCGAAYYAQAPPDITRYLFTDDLRRARELTRYDRHINLGDDLQEFYQLARFDNVFMGNSTFAWFAAFLGRAREVRYPSRWFASGPPNSERPRNKKWIEV